MFESVFDALCGISIRVSTPTSTAAKSIRQSKSSQPRGPLVASSIGGSKNIDRTRSGTAAYAVQTVANGGSKLPIFVRRNRPHLVRLRMGRDRFCQSFDRASRLLNRCMGRKKSRDDIFDNRRLLVGA